MVNLIISIIMLVAAPLIYHTAIRFKKAWNAIDTALSFVVTALVVIHLLPESIRTGGWVCVVFAFSGIFLPSFLERLWQPQAEGIHIASLIVGVVGLGIHGFMDGAALAVPSIATAGKETLSLAVILHRLPVGVLIWSIFIPKGRRLPALLLFFLALATVGGFFVGDISSQFFDSAYLAYFQALVSGSLIHAGLDRHDGGGVSV